MAASMMTQCEANISPGNTANLPKVSEEVTPKKQPNFIVILTDDQGWGTTSITVDPAVPESKSDFFKTPNLENLRVRACVSRRPIPATPTARRRAPRY